MNEEVSIEKQKNRRNLYLGSTVVSALSTGVVVGCAVFNGFVLMPTVPVALVIAGGATIGNAVAWRRKANTVSNLEDGDAKINANNKKEKKVKTKTK